MDEEEKIGKDDFYEEEEVTPKDLFKFAKSILLALAVFFFLGMLSALFWKNTIIFEAVKNILPSIATMVIGFYFGRSN
jgi:VIT1/CCC1 family predicted Fe2+/Mn2+ transporter